MFAEWGPPDGFRCSRFMAGRVRCLRGSSTKELEREAADMLAQVRSDPSSFLSDWQLSESDRDKLAERAGYEILRQTTEEAFVHGVWGYVDDTLCLVRRGASMFPRSV